MFSVGLMRLSTGARLTRYQSVPKLRQTRFESWNGSARSRVRLLSAMRYENDQKKVDTLAELIANRYGGEATLRDLERRNTWKRQEVERLAKRFKYRLAIVNNLAGENGGLPSLSVKIPQGGGFAGSESSKTPKR